MSQHNDTRTNLAADKNPATRLQANKQSLLSNLKQQTFFDAQVAFAKSKHGRAQKQKDKHGYRYHQIKQAATQTQSDTKECKDDS